MLNIQAMPLGIYQTNTYIVSARDSGSCAVIDPGGEPRKILNTLNELGLTLDAVLLTHGHFDHVGAVEALVSATGCALWMHRADWDMETDRKISRYFPLAGKPVCEISFCAEGDTISAGGLNFKVLATPGHTRGSVCFLCEDALFSGDTLFAGSCGRTDLHGGDPEAIRASLRRLAALEDSLRVFPGHSKSTTLSIEKRYNPFMK